LTSTPNTVPPRAAIRRCQRSSAPRRPEVDDDHLAAEVRERQLPAAAEPRQRERRRGGALAARERVVDAGVRIARRQPVAQQAHERDDADDRGQRDGSEYPLHALRTG
jgi:hypothetical protein